jgi:hypothetical protein
MFQELDVFLSSGVGQGAHTLLSLLGRANLSHWTVIEVSCRTYSVPEMLCFSVLKSTGRCIKSRNSTILIAIHHCQNPTESSVTCVLYARSFLNLALNGKEWAYFFHIQGVFII